MYTQLGYQLTKTVQNGGAGHGLAYSKMDSLFYWDISDTHLSHEQVYYIQFTEVCWSILDVQCKLWHLLVVLKYQTYRVYELTFKANIFLFIKLLNNFCSVSMWLLIVIFSKYINQGKLFWSHSIPSLYTIHNVDHVG